MPRTRQREAIYEVLAEAGRPLTREEVLRLGRRKLPRLGSATVDRAIRELVGEHRIVGLSFPGQARRFELPAEREHPHFICRVCDRVFDLPLAMELPPVTPPPGFEVTGGEVIYSGRCPECAKPRAKA